MTGAHPVPSRAPGRLGGVALVLGGALSVQFGSALAALLFPRTGVAGAVTLRLTIGALVMLVAAAPGYAGTAAATGAPCWRSGWPWPA